MTTMNQLKNSIFPTLATPTVANWAPVLFRPILGSPEQYVIAVAAVGESAFHVEAANEWRRLDCLFGAGSSNLLIVAQAAIKALEQDICDRGLNALAQYSPVASSVVLGDLRKGEASSVEEVAKSWMRHLSSLYSARQLVEVADLELPAILAAEAAERQPKEKLPELVLDFVNKASPLLSTYFSAPRRRKNAYDAKIDFSGKRVVANFEMLTTHATSVDRIKQRLWDLRVDRGGPKIRSGREHQMFVRHSPKDMFKGAQFDRIEGALESLEQQADQQEIRMFPMTSVAEIGRRLIATELALPLPG